MPILQAVALSRSSSEFDVHTNAVQCMSFSVGFMLCVISCASHDDLKRTDVHGDLILFSLRPVLTFHFTFQLALLALFLPQLEGLFTSKSSHDLIPNPPR